MYFIIILLSVEEAVKKVVNGKSLRGISTRILSQLKCECKVTHTDYEQAKIKVYRESFKNT